MCSARETAISSSTLPPEYINATTAPASRWPSASAAVMDTSAIASTPSRPASKSQPCQRGRHQAHGHSNASKKEPAEYLQRGPLDLRERRLDLCQGHTSTGERGSCFERAIDKTG